MTFKLDMEMRSLVRAFFRVYLDFNVLKPHNQLPQNCWVRIVSEEILDRKRTL